MAKVPESFGDLERFGYFLKRERPPTHYTDMFGKVVCITFLSTVGVRKDFPAPRAQF